MELMAQVAPVYMLEHHIDKCICVIKDSQYNEREYNNHLRRLRHAPAEGDSERQGGASWPTAPVDPLSANSNPGK